MPHFRGAKYEIHVKNTGKYSLCVNGERVDGSVVPLFAEGSAVHVEVTV